MHTFIANYNEDIFASEKDIAENKQNVEKIFNLPFPEQLKITLSQDSVKKISRFYIFMQAEKVTKMDFYLGHDQDINLFEPMHNNMCFSSNQYIDYNDSLFRTFTTDSCLVSIDKFRASVLFSILYVNSYTEQSFDYVLDIKNILAVN